MLTFDKLIITGYSCYSLHALCLCFPFMMYKVLFYFLFLCAIDCQSTVGSSIRDTINARIRPKWTN